MSNIREDKGYTYGIYSSLGTMQKTGYFIISTEVNTESTQAAIDEILKEVKKLRTELISEKELELVKNYIIGDMQRMFDGAMSAAARFKTINDYDLDFRYYENYLEKIKAITPQQIKDLSEQYFHEDSFYIITAGGK